MHSKKKVAIVVIEDVHIHVALKTRVSRTWKLYKIAMRSSVKGHRHIC